MIYAYIIYSTIILIIILLCCVPLLQMRSVTADAITAKLVSFLEVNDLELQKVAGFGSGGASVMVGCRNGVATQLKRVSSPPFVNDFNFITIHKVG